MKVLNASYNLVTNEFTDKSEGILSFSNDKCTILLHGHASLQGKKDDLSQIAEYFCQSGTHITETLEGLFILCIYNKENKAVTVIQDRNTSPITLYYTVFDNTVYLSTSLKTLLKESGIPRSLNENVIEEFIANGYIYGRQTLVNHVYKIEPYHALLVSGHKAEQISVSYSSSGVTKGQALDAFKPTLDKAILDLTGGIAGDINMPLSGGYDSSYIAHVISTQTDKAINAFSIGGKTGKSELPAVEKNVPYFPRTTLHVAMTSPDTIQHLTEIVERLEGSVFEVGIFLQYELMKKVAEDGKKSLICGECADQVFNPYFYQSDRILPNTGNGVIQYDFSEYPYIFGTQLILKKSGIMANSFGIETRYPYLDDDVVLLSEPLGEINGKDKRCHVANCKECLPMEVIRNIAKQGGATDCHSLFENDMEVNQFFEQIEKTDFYRKYEELIKRYSFEEKQKQSGLALVKTKLRNFVLSVLHIGIESRKQQLRFMEEMKLRIYLCITYLVEFEKEFILN